MDGAVAEACWVEIDVVATTGGGLPVDIGLVVVGIGEGPSEAFAAAAELSDVTICFGSSRESEDVTGWASDFSREASGSGIVSF